MHLNELLPMFLFAVFFVIGLIVRKLLFRILDHWSQKTTNTIDDAIVNSCRFPSFFWIMLLAVYFCLKFSALSEHTILISKKTIEVTLIFSMAMAISGILRSTIQDYGSKFGEHVSFTSLTQNLSSIVVLSLSFLMIMNVMGVSVPSIITAFGIGGLAVALAAQDTLTNLFSGIYLVGARNVKPGDYIRLDTGEEGYIFDISLRVTKIKTYQNNVIIIPNQKLAAAIITNYHLPEKNMTLMLPISVSYNADPEKVCEMILDETRKASHEVQGLIDHAEPFIRFVPGFGDSSLNFTLFCQISEFMDHFLAEHELRMRIFKRFRQEGIEIPFPQRVVHLKQS